MCLRFRLANDQDVVLVLLLLLFPLSFANRSLISLLLTFLDSLTRRVLLCRRRDCSAPLSSFWGLGQEQREWRESLCCRRDPVVRRR